METVPALAPPTVLLIVMPPLLAPNVRSPFAVLVPDRIFPAVVVVLPAELRIKPPEPELDAFIVTAVVRLSEMLTSPVPLSLALIVVASSSSGIIFVLPILPPGPAVRLTVAAFTVNAPSVIRPVPLALKVMTPVAAVLVRLAPRVMLPLLAVVFSVMFPGLVTLEPVEILLDEASVNAPLPSTAVASNTPFALLFKSLTFVSAVPPVCKCRVEAYTERALVLVPRFPVVLWRLTVFP